LRRAISVGIAELDRGAYEEIDDSELDSFLDNLAVAEPSRRDPSLLAKPIRTPKPAR
jgi:hypothetical protein